MRYRLRTLMIVLAIAPLLLWGAWRLWEELKPNQTFIHDAYIDFDDGRGPQPINTTK
jgi:hypothetical protein